MLSKDFIERIENFASSLTDVVSDTGSLEGYIIFRLNPSKYTVENPNQLNFAILHRKQRPLLLELASDRNLVKTLCQKYESVMPAKLMDANRWLRLLGSGQVSEAEIIDLIKLAHHLVWQSQQNVAATLS